MTSVSIFSISKVNNSEEIDNNSKPINLSTPPTSSWRGYCVSLQKGASTIVQGSKRAMKGFVDVTAEIFDDTNHFAGTLKKLNKYVWDLIELIGKKPGLFDHFKTMFNPAIGCVDAWQVATDIRYFKTGKHKEDHPLAAHARLGICFANTAGALLWLNELGFPLRNLATSIGNTRVFGFLPGLVRNIPGIRNVTFFKHAAQAIGNIRFFSIIKKIPLGSVVGGVMTIAFGLLSADSFLKWKDPTASSFDKKCAAIDTVLFALDSLLELLALVGVVSVIGMGVIGGVWLVLNIGVIAYKVLCKDSQAKKEASAKDVQPPKDVQSPKEIESTNHIVAISEVHKIEEAAQQLKYAIDQTESIIETTLTIENLQPSDTVVQKPEDPQPVEGQQLIEDLKPLEGQQLIMEIGIKDQSALLLTENTNQAT